MYGKNDKGEHLGSHTCISGINSPLLEIHVCDPKLCSST